MSSPSPNPLAPLDLLRRHQNPDGGWGYYPGKASWLEPTLYGAFALASEPAGDRAFRLIQSWTLPEGGWRIAPNVAESNWTSALCLNLYHLRGVHDQAFERSAALLLRTLGTEGSFSYQMVARLRPSVVRIDTKLQGWPWRAGCASWVEPTVHALVSLRRIGPALGSKAQRITAERISMAQRMLLDRQCSDGGWNYGNTEVLGERLPSYAETTAIALVGLQGLDWPRKQSALARAKAYAALPQPALGASWLRLGLRLQGVPASDLPPVSIRANDLLVAGVAALSDRPLAFDTEKKFTERSHG
jgi:hypothetical protein